MKKDIIINKTLKKIYLFLLKRRNSIIIRFSRFFSLKDNWIVFESNPDLSDNSYALYSFLCQNGYQNKYKIYWLIRDKKKINSNKLNSINYLLESKSIKKLFILQLAKYIIYDHTNIISIFKRKGQISVYLCHGTPIKGPKNDVKIGEYTRPDYIIGTSKLACNWTCDFWSAPQNIGLPLGYPRNDYFFNLNHDIKEKIARHFHFDKFSKVILWMPTFRQSCDSFLSEDYLNNETGLPLINSLEELIALNEYLKEHILLLMLKLHPLQANLPAFDNQYSNLLIVRNKDLDNLDVQLYEFVATSDALITDYSSISVDYLLLNRPIIFTTPDYEQYKSSRGFIVDDVMDYLPGPHVNTIEELRHAIKNIALNVDYYQKERIDATNLFHKFQDGNSSKRITETLGL